MSISARMKIETKCHIHCVPMEVPFYALKMDDMRSLNVEVDLGLAQGGVHVVLVYSLMEILPHFLHSLADCTTTMAKLTVHWRQQCCWRRKKEMIFRFGYQKFRKIIAKNVSMYKWLYQNITNHWSSL